MKAGDTVHDAVTGEDWVLAYYDQERDEAAWCGWPEGYIKDASARLTVVEPCPEEESLDMLQRWASKNGSDHRISAARRLLNARAEGVTGG